MYINPCTVSGENAPIAFMKYISLSWTLTVHTIKGLFSSLYMWQRCGYRPFLCERLFWIEWVTFSAIVFKGGKVSYRGKHKVDPGGKPVCPLDYPPLCTLGVLQSVLQGVLWGLLFNVSSTVSSNVQYHPMCSPGVACVLHGVLQCSIQFVIQCVPVLKCALQNVLQCIIPCSLRYSPRCAKWPP